MRLRTCSECPQLVTVCNAQTCSAVCAKNRHARLRRERRAVVGVERKPEPKIELCPYCGGTVPPTKGHARVTCGSEACRWKHKKANRPPRRARLLARLEDGWDIDGVIDLRRRRLEREEEMSALRMMLRGVA